MADTSAALDGASLCTSGLLAGGRVATSMGWCPVEALTAGDLVVTFDNGMQPVAEARRETILVTEMIAPNAYGAVLVPSGALGNSSDFELLPDQGVMIESDAACDFFGDPFAVVPAKSLVGYRDISRIPARSQIDAVTLTFASEQVIYLHGGATVYCAGPVMNLLDMDTQSVTYERVSANPARALVESMILKDHSAQMI